MDTDERLKRLTKLLKKNEKDITELKRLLEKPTKSDKRAAESIVNQLVVRAETFWQSLRGLGRHLKDSK